MSRRAASIKEAAVIISWRQSEGLPMRMMRIVVILLQIIAAILMIAMVWGIVQGRWDINYGAMAIVIALVSLGIERLEGRR